MRTDDVVYRYGGEEFCVLLPGASQNEAQAVADRVVSAMRLILLPNGRHITVSVGVADGRAGDVAGTLETADRAMYAAKAGGRDRSRLARSSRSEPVSRGAQHESAVAVDEAGGAQHRRRPRPSTDSPSTLRTSTLRSAPRRTRSASASAHRGSVGGGRERDEVVRAALEPDQRHAARGDHER